MRIAAKLAAAAAALLPLTLAATGSAENQACATHAPNFSAPLPAGTGTHVADTSSSSTYGNATCPDRYVVEATHVDHRGVRLSAAWGEATPGDEMMCSHAYVDADLYVEEETAVRGEVRRSWRFVETIHGYGQWHAARHECTVSTARDLGIHEAVRYRVGARAARGPMDGQRDAPRKVKITITSI